MHWSHLWLLFFLSIPLVFAEVPEHNPGLDRECSPGFQWSRGTASCKQANCPPGAGRTYTYDCNCGEAWDQPYKTCYKNGLATHCVARGQECEATESSFDPLTGECQMGFVLRTDKQDPSRKNCVKAAGDPICVYAYAEYLPEQKKCRCIEGYRWVKEKKECIEETTAIAEFCRKIEHAIFTPGPTPTCRCDKFYVSYQKKYCIHVDHYSLCQRKANTFLDITDGGQCKCKPPLVVDRKKEECVTKEELQAAQEEKPEEKQPETPPKEHPDCPKARQEIAQSRGISASVRAELEEMNVVVKRMDDFSSVHGKTQKELEKENPALPPFSNIPTEVWRDKYKYMYKPNHDAQLAALAKAEETLLLAENEIENNQCGSALIFVQEAQKTIQERYKYFKPASCAIRAKPTVQKDARSIVSTAVILPEGCQCSWLQFTLVKRTRTFYTVWPITSKTRFRTQSVCKAQLADNYIDVGELLEEIPVNEYYGRHGLAGIYWKSTWIYGDVEPVYY